MDFPTAAALTALASYLIGSVPFGYVTARLVAGIDIRTAGSGNIGATNVGRVLGLRWAVVVLLLDALKGLLPVLHLPWAMSGSTGTNLGHLRVLAGVCTIVGHMFPCWLGFRGGKGVATSLGVVAVVAPWATLAAFAAFVLAFAASRIVSLASVSAAVAFAAWQAWQLWPEPFSPETWSLAAFSILVPLLILVRHRTNIARLMRGTESRFQFRGRKSDAANDEP